MSIVVFGVWAIHMSQICSLNVIGRLQTRFLSNALVVCYELYKVKSMNYIGMRITRPKIARKGWHYRAYVISSWTSRPIWRDFESFSWWLCPSWWRSCQKYVWVLKWTSSKLPPHTTKSSKLVCQKHVYFVQDPPSILKQIINLITGPLVPSNHKW